MQGVVSSLKEGEIDANWNDGKKLLGNAEGHTPPTEYWLLKRIQNDMGIQFLEMVFENWRQ